MAGQTQLTQQSQVPHYKPNFLAYSRPPDGWHDEPFEYVFTFQQTFATTTTAADQADLLNQPMQMDPDADFYMRGLAILVDQVSYHPANNILFSMRLRNAFNRALDSAYIPFPAYAANPNLTGIPSGTSPWEATPWWPELYFPANSFLSADFQAINTGKFYSFHIYLQGVKRFQNETCKPQAAAKSS